MSTQYRFLEPLDVLLLRGNKLFGDAGSFGESLVVPWPSVAAGALRSLMLTTEGTDLGDFANGLVDHPSLGTPSKPGSFTLSAFTLARSDKGKFEALRAAPADLVFEATDLKVSKVRRLQPQLLQHGMSSSASLNKLPILSQPDRSKASSGYYLTEVGWQHYLSGALPSTKELLHGTELWKIDSRVGIGLNAEQHSADDGKLFSMQALAFDQKQGVGYLLAVHGAQIPERGTLRMGGDGRGADMRTVPAPSSKTDYAALVAAQRCRIVLTTPGLFPGGWKLPGVDDQQHLTLPGISARLVCAAVSRAEVISGWDLAQRQPKPALRVAPTGSVYWLEELKATPEALGKLVESGLWSDPCEHPARRAEGFNRFTFATY